MPLTLELHWALDGARIDARLIRLLGEIADRGSLQQAVVHAGYSYRHAWELLGRLEAALGQRLVLLERGRGATLTTFGARLAQTAREVETRLAPELKRSAGTLNRPLSRMQKAAAARVSICASHDLALGSLAEALPRRGGPAVDLHYQGSLDALISLGRNRCDIAGFHVPDLPGWDTLIEPFWPWLKSQTLRLVHFAVRQQGLIVARNNPLHIATLADLVHRRARFVNRQPGSGTRIFFDALIATQRIRPGQINGYRTEEFTHAAVAALVASGIADAAFGIEAAAAQQGLSFVPLASERYFLAARAATLARPAPQALLKALSSRWFRASARALPGYSFPERAEARGVREALESGAGAAYTMQSARARSKTTRSSK